MSSPAKQATLLFLIKDNGILLAMKKRGFGAGRWNGVGGKPEANETMEAAAVRECQEEIGVTPQEFKQVAELDFYFPEYKSNLDVHVVVYLCTQWQGEPVETEEMKPQWYNNDAIPYDSMWEDDKDWLPQVLAGKYVEAWFRFDDNDKVLSQEVKERLL